VVQFFVTHFAATFFLSVVRRAVVLATLGTVLAGGGFAAAQGVDEKAFDRCRAMTDQGARLRCLQSLLQTPAAPASNAVALGRWRLVRTPNPDPKGGKEAVAIMRSADFTGSDPDFAGLMLRCGDPDIEVLAVLLTPLPPRASPKVSINGTRYDGTVTSPGAAVLLPPSVAALATGAWQALPKLDIAVESDGKTVKGTIALDGLAAALQTLTASCATR
jgi:hypothetical protein